MNEATRSEPTGRSWPRIFRRTFNEASDDNIGMLAAGVAFYAFLAFIPMLGATVLTYGLVADPTDVGRHLQSLFRLLPVDAAKLVAAQMVSVTETSASKTGIGLGLALLLAFYGAMNGASAIVTALNMIHDQKEGRSCFKTVRLASGITVGLVLVGVPGVLALGAFAVVEKLLPTMPGVVRTLLRGGPWLTAATIVCCIVAMIYRVAPDRPVASWRSVLPGALFSTVAWLLVTFAFGLYVSHIAHYTATYGALGAVIALLMWLYLSAYVLLLGAELNFELEGAAT